MAEYTPLVSVIIPFYNPNPQFMGEAIESVLAQTYPEWELLLVDDGSNQECVALAFHFMARYPERIRIYHHVGRKNRGVSASRQLGIDSARGELIAFLDADDVWLPEKLEQQLHLMSQYPEAGMSYGNTLYWYSWDLDREDRSRDYIPELGYKVEGMFQPGQLVPLHLSGRAVIPCTCSVIFRRAQLKLSGGMEESFTGMYEDQVIYVKISLSAPILVSTQCWDKYRQHTQSLSSVATRSGQEPIARLMFLQWLERYMSHKQVQDPDIWQELYRELWHYRQPSTFFNTESKRKILLWIKKWLLKIEETLLPASVRRRIWIRENSG
jgi:glycosyltransferase involved in cell wall biosynthesis